LAIVIQLSKIVSVKLLLSNVLPTSVQWSGGNFLMERIWFILCK